MLYKVLPARGMQHYRQLLSGRCCGRLVVVLVDAGVVGRRPFRYCVLQGAKPHRSGGCRLVVQLGACGNVEVLAS
jgi:hypothetical protein